MKENQIKVTVVTSRNTYSGTLKINNPNLRTSDLLNNPNLFPRYSDQNRLDSALRLYRVTELIDGRFPYKTYEKRDIFISKILFFFDEFLSRGSNAEKSRVQKAWNQQSKLPSGKGVTAVSLEASVSGSSFFEIRGKFFGRFKQLMKQNFISLIDVSVTQKIIKNEKGEILNIPYPIRSSFVAVNTASIISYTIP